MNMKHNSEVWLSSGESFTLIEAETIQRISWVVSNLVQVENLLNQDF